MEEPNPYLPPTTAPAKGAAKNTLRRLVGVALYTFAALTGLAFVGCLISAIVFVGMHGRAALPMLQQSWDFALTMTGYLFATVGLIWLGRRLRRPRKEAPTSGIVGEMQ